MWLQVKHDPKLMEVQLTVIVKIYSPPRAKMYDIEFGIYQVLQCIIKDKLQKQKISLKFGAETAVDSKLGPSLSRLRQINEQQAMIS